MLSLPVVDSAAAEALAVDTAVQDRAQEVEFAQASQALRVLVQKGDAKGARKLFKDLETRFAQHPTSMIDVLVSLAAAAPGANNAFYPP